jgi:hypothetical protein
MNDTEKRGLSPIFSIPKNVVCPRFYFRQVTA